MGGATPKGLAAAWWLIDEATGLRSSGPVPAGPLISIPDLAVAPAETDREEVALWLSDWRSAVCPATLLLVLGLKVVIPEESPAAVLPAASVWPAETDKGDGAD